MMTQSGNIKASVAIPKGTKQEELQDLLWQFISGDDLEEYFKDVFGQQLGEIYVRLFHDVSRIYEKWAVIKHIYASIGLLSKLDQDAKQFVWLLLEILGEDLILHLARLTDKSRMGSSENLSLLTIVELINHPSAESTIPPLLEDAKEKAENARKWRNKTIAHRDKKVSLELEKLPPLDEQYVEEALTAAGEVLTQLYGIYSGNPIEMQSWTPTGTVESIDAFLRYFRFALFSINDGKHGNSLLREFESIEEIQLDNNSSHHSTVGPVHQTGGSNQKYG